MLAAINGREVQCNNASMWEMRMLSDSPQKQIRSYYPDVGRGSIEHATISHASADSRLQQCGKKTIWEKILGWLDV